LQTRPKPPLLQASTILLVVSGSLKENDAAADDNPSIFSNLAIALTTQYKDRDGKVRAPNESESVTIKLSLNPGIHPILA
ncbi:hypothetical protein ACC745_39185, partial [Rhizobium ruizarguesonis]